MVRSMEFDFIVIGGGSGGYASARAALSHTRSIAMIDAAEELGGLCILRGCMPSKTLIYAAEVLHRAQLGAALGLEIPAPRADMAAVAARKRRIIQEFADYRRESLESGKFELFRSAAHFVGPLELKLADGTRLRGKKILISTGSKVKFPPIPGLDEVPIWTSDDVLDLDFIPESVIVLGAGAVGCELAQFLNRIGSRVTVIQRGPTILSGVPADAARVVEQVFTDEGMELFTRTAVESVRKVGSEIEVRFQCHGKKVQRRAAYCLNALGRSPNTESLNLETAGVVTRANGQIITDFFQQTSNPDIYAAGDCCSPHEIVHVAVQQGETAARHAFGAKVDALHYDDLILVTFTDPQVASAGLSEEQLTARGRRFISASYPFDDHGKSILMEAGHGFVRVTADALSGEILGALIVGRDAGELIHCFAVALAMKASVSDLLRVQWYHPTLSEIISYPIEELAEKLPPA
jgi:pyruvate/2-oxoglutarate dehydrogenase complex dihydrolipoamide dehydrogenase (E3) component